MIQSSALLHPATAPANPIPFALIGWGWRAQQFAAIAVRAPHWFRLTGILRQKPDGTEPASTVTSLDRLLQTEPQFVVVSVPRATAAELTLELARRGVPVLTETPPAEDLAGLRHLWSALPADARVQVAEQYALQPYHMAAAAIARSGRLGQITHVQASVAHDYHGFALIRHFLGVGRTPLKLNASHMTAPIVAGPGRDGPPTTEILRASTQWVGLLDFGSDRTAVYDFTNDQYFSWIRSSRLLIRGERGELADDTVRWLPSFDTPARQQLTRFDGGAKTNLQGIAHQGYALGEDWLYRNPFGPIPLPDDFIAMASVLWSMHHYLETGESFYSLADGCHDHAIGLLMREAATTGTELELTGLPWMDAS